MDNMATGSAAGNRIEALLDAGSFVEIGGAVTARTTDFNMQEKETPADGVITGYGVIDGNLVYVYSQDASVLNGAIGEMHAKKIANIYDMAMKMGAPVIGLVDCAGLRLQEATDALEAFGNLYLKQTMASGVIPQITAVFGTCGGGLAVVPALTDFTFMEGKSGKLFINSPNAIPGNEISKCDTSSAQFQSEKAGLVDDIGTEEEILGSIRSLVCMLPCNNEEDASYDECADDLNRACTGIENAAEDTAIALAQISDSNIFFETKKHYAKDMVTGFIRLNGMTVGAVANRSKVYNADAEVTDEFDGSLSAGGAGKAAEFVKFCDAFNIPVLTLTNVSGFEASECAEKNLAREAARLTYAFADATVPKVNVIIGKAYGSAYVTMNSKALGADMVYAWQDAEIGMMDASLAAKIMYAGADADVIKEKASEYKEIQSSPLAAARRGYVDTIIAPADTRKYVIGALEMLFTKREDRPVKKHGTV
ncbi:acyl-CoA carboxylase subunit beta [[Clostridium] hylemonae]|uniref:Carboxyl transferase domain protein n=1 Tax=[Clostridium] hylemonae DSM 15053 TaxID=553973 RepID=C0BWJ1_9FIRM|nr:carboxyl transferase domain-containing protein [[Clostridium] hylemonae]EEG75673.1 carboxyl transferase domain protein [[Clostridium] hylemonae DSM 15053]QEK17804.1 Propionyl-CoA carboxylase beta chain [[Clostridium] hylemonae DSM 15053]BDF04821.1 propionyl-CoA carboxylase subunit beta [[Clostridium] hylemonae]